MAHANTRDLVSGHRSLRRSLRCSLLWTLLSLSWLVLYWRKNEAATSDPAFIPQLYNTVNQSEGIFSASTIRDKIIVEREKGVGGGGNLEGERLSERER